jgi:NIMA (never in mitosis gene a)-related kinase
LKSLRHPNIIGYFDAFLADAHLCIVMEYADGGDLALAIENRRKASRRYHEREAMAIFAQIALALCHVHQRRIMHRDVKSQNVFLTSGGVVKLGDFGVAKVLTATEHCAATCIGTPHCVAPEVCENHPYDFKADVWCLGVIFYQLLALECPFSGASFAALAVRICTAEPRPVPSVYSPEARILLGRLLAKKAEERPSSVEILSMPHVRRSVAALPWRPRRVTVPACGGLPTPLDSTVEEACPSSPSATGDGFSPLRMLRRRATNALRRAKTLPEVPSPEKVCKSYIVSSRHRAASDQASPRKVRSGGSPRKIRGCLEVNDMSKSPKKAARVWQATSIIPGADEALDTGTSPGSRGSVSDLLAFFLESPVGTGPAAKRSEAANTARSDGADTTSTRDDGSSRYAGTAGGGSDSGGEGCSVEDHTSCTMLLNALEREFGFA